MSAWTHTIWEPQQRWLVGTPVRRLTREEVDDAWRRLLEETLPPDKQVHACAHITSMGFLASGPFACSYFSVTGIILMIFHETRIDEHIR